MEEEEGSGGVSLTNREGVIFSPPLSILISVSHYLSIPFHFLFFSSPAPSSSASFLSPPTPLTSLIIPQNIVSIITHNNDSHPCKRNVHCAWRIFQRWRPVYELITWVFHIGLLRLACVWVYVWSGGVGGEGVHRGQCCFNMTVTLCMLTALPVPITGPSCFPIISAFSVNRALCVALPFILGVGGGVRRRVCVGCYNKKVSAETTCHCCGPKWQGLHKSSHYRATFWMWNVFGSLFLLFCCCAIFKFCISFLLTLKLQLDVLILLSFLIRVGWYKSVLSSLTRK